MPTGPGTLQPRQDGPRRAIPLAGSTGDPHQPTVGIILLVLMDTQVPPPRQGRSHGGEEGDKRVGVKTFLAGGCWEEVSVINKKRGIT